MAVRKPPNKKSCTTLEQATVGQLTSNIKNKQARSEVYGKLKVIKKVRNQSGWLDLCSGQETAIKTLTISSI